MSEVTVAILSAVLVIVGAMGSILPILPGPPLSFAGLWLYAWWTGYDKISPMALAVFGILTALTFITDIMAPALGAKGYKSSQWGVWGSVLGAFLGIFIMGPLGILLGPLAGAFIGEVLHSRNTDHALRIAWGSFLGFVIGSLFKLAVIAGMLVYLTYAIIWK